MIFNLHEGIHRDYFGYIITIFKNQKGGCPVNYFNAHSVQLVHIYRIEKVPFLLGSIKIIPIIA